MLGRNRSQVFYMREMWYLVYKNKAAFILLITPYFLQNFAAMLSAINAHFIT